MVKASFLPLGKPVPGGWKVVGIRKSADVSEAMVFKRDETMTCEYCILEFKNKTKEFTVVASMNYSEECEKASPGQAKVVLNGSPFLSLSNYSTSFLMDAVGKTLSSRARALRDCFSVISDLIAKDGQIHGVLASPKETSEKFAKAFKAFTESSRKDFKREADATTYPAPYRQELRRAFAFNE